MMSGVHFHTAQQRREQAGTPMERDWPRLPGCWDRGVGRCVGGGLIILICLHVLMSKIFHDKK